MLHKRQVISCSWLPGWIGKCDAEPFSRARTRATGMIPKIVIEAYDPTWPSKFEAEERRLRDAVGPVAIRIEHNGSTAVRSRGQAHHRHSDQRSLARTDATVQRAARR